MSYDSDEEAQYYESAAGYAEAEAQNEYDMHHEEYLQSLLQSHQYRIYALEIVLDMLHSKQFERSKMTATEYLTDRLKYMKEQLNKPAETELPSDEPDTTALPF